MFLTGDDLVFDLVNNGGAATLAFANNWICVTLIDHNLRPLVDYQAAPLVKTIPGNSVFNSITEWIAYGGCLVMNTFDAVEVAGTTERLAEFTDPNGTTGQYSFAAATLNEDATFNNNIVYLPYDLINVYTDPANPPPQPALSSRAQLLSDVLLSFGHIGQSPATPVPEAGVFSVDNYPNPFNPHTKIAFNLPRRGELSLRIYNLRGELVRILINEMRPAGEDFVVWDGSDDSGRGVASGMYFCEARFPGERQVQKMALVR